MDSMSITPVGKTPLSREQNRRSGNRHRLEIHATLISDEQSAAPVTVLVTEISVAGLGLRSPQALAYDAVYHVRSFDTLLPPGMKVKLVSQRELVDGQFEIGVKTVPAEAQI